MLGEQYHRSVNRCVIHDGWHFYLVDYGASVQQLLFRPDVEPRNRKNRIQLTIPGCFTRKHRNFELSITATASALTCLWTTKDTRMISLPPAGPWSQMVLILEFWFQNQSGRLQESHWWMQEIFGIYSLDCMIREPKSINKVYKGPIYMEPYSVVCTRSSLF